MRSGGTTAGDRCRGRPGRPARPPQPAIEVSERRGDGSRFAPRVRSANAPKWTVSRVLFRRVVARPPAGIIHLGAALLRRSSALTRALAPTFRWIASDGPPSTAPLFELAPGGACPAAGHPAAARGLLPHDFNLACASLPAPLNAGRSSAIGGVVSVALSLGSPRVAVSDLPALWSPDFPPADGVCPPAIPRPPPALQGYRDLGRPGNRHTSRRAACSAGRLPRGVSKITI
jgi:hypothetical protein